MKNSRLNLVLLALLFPVFSVFAQVPVQVVRGKVIDADGKTGLPGANVILVGSDPLIGITTDAGGSFRMEKVPVGRHSFGISFMGYKSVVIPEILVSTGKETVLTVTLEENVITSKEVEIKASVKKDQAINPMAMVSARSFNVEESRRYAGSADDPLRAASNFAGVASSADINSNQIVIRGNSPRGVLWRVDGVDIPNPNHYAYVGNSGGGITMFSSQVLNNSDFYTAAFPAQYGNALSGVFDMRFRTGNNEHREYAVQAGIQGLEVAAEGPFSKKSGSSYLFNYRYSILAFLQLIDPSMKNKIPQYQDLSFKLHFPTKRAGTFSLVGIGGISRSSGVSIEDTTQWKKLEDRTQSTLNNNMGAVALIHTIGLARKTLLNSYLSATYNDIFYENYLMTPQMELQPQQYIFHKNYRFTASINLNHKFSPRHTNRTGVNYTRLFYNIDIRAINPFTGIYSQFDKGSGNTDLVQAYSESKIDLSDRFHLSGGIHVQYFLLNHHLSVEPRLAFRWQISDKHAVSCGYGLHSQAEDAGVYLAETNNLNGNELKIQPNRGLDFSKAHHIVLGYDFSIKPDLRFRTEVYAQFLYKIPVMPGSYYSLINSNGGYYNDTLVNDGTGRNLGIDITFEKFLTKQYYYLVTVSLFTSKYKGGDGIERNTRYNSGYVVNLLGGKEWTVRKKNLFGVNIKATLTGGEYYVPIDLQESIQQHREIPDETNAYRSQLPAFYYFDLTLTYRTNHRKFAGTWAIQMKNLLNQKPVTGYVYNDFTQSIEEVRSMGIIPFISYKVEF